MENKDILLDLLEIFIVTYNRSPQLDSTLLQIQPSLFANCKITILDNCSTDDTETIYKKYIGKYPNLNYKKNKINIGGNANIIRAFELSNGFYTWVLCDDDKYDFTDCDDVIKIISEKQVDMIHMGAHDFKPWSHGGIYATPQNLVKSGYDYFKCGSFLPCNLFKTSFFYKTIIDSYHNIVNYYPHMIPVIHAYDLNHSIYVSKTRVVTAVVGLQGHIDNFIGKWLDTCLRLKNKEDIKTAFYSESYQGVKPLRLYWSTYILYDRKISFDSYKKIFSLYRFAYFKMAFYLTATPFVLPFLPLIRKLKLHEKNTR